MSPGDVDFKVIAERAQQVRQAVRLLERKAALPEEEFLSEADHAAAAETYVRRSLEALSDLGRHLLAKGYGEAVAEYSGVAVKCGERGLLSRAEAVLFRSMLAYRNRLVHQYLEVGAVELYRIARDHAADLLTLLERLETAAKKLAKR